MIEPAFAAVSALAPERVEVLLADDTVDLETIDFLVPGPADPEILQQMPSLSRLAVVQATFAGTDWLEPYLPPQATLCSARGARDSSVAEWVVAALLGVTSRQLAYARIHCWTKRNVAELSGWTVLIVGMGSIGRRVAGYLAPFGTVVIGVASRAREDLHGIDELPVLLPKADAVVLLTPLTDATRGLIGARELAGMRDGALLVNAARGPVVDTDALVAEVTTGRLCAVLDVADPEPLPDDHPLWLAPGVMSITPHIAGLSPAGNARAAELAGAQLARWCAGEELHNVVRRGTG